ncbi:putative mitochondrial protein AtMg01250 [Silene latifolia]|uniref:putative mitochondrial protein AtMg01250 n=1 Tax=Silene latifolia TaxID=37657 RepID=UPI003D775E02
MAYVTSPTYSLSLNKGVFGYFKGKRGNRQGDPMSHLLFTLCIEYLTRLINVITLKPGFNFHPLCKKLKLSHLCFADDVLLFCRGDFHFIKLLMRALKSFGDASRLQVNHNKSEIYMNGLSAQDKDKCLRVSGFNLDTFPFRYL